MVRSAGAAWQGVVYYGAGDGSGLHVFDLVPFRAGEAHAGEPLPAGKDNATVSVIPGVVFILLQDGDLNPVDSADFVEAKT